MKRVLLLLVAGFSAILLQATVFSYLPWTDLKPDLLLIVVLYVGFFLAPTEGGVLAFLLGYLADLFSASVMGLFTFTRVVAWFVAKLASGVLHVKSVAAQTIFVAAYTVLDALVLVGALRFFGGPDYPAPDLDARVWFQVLLNTAAAPFVITALGRIEKRFSSGFERRRLDLMP
jgi:rod shape-determining protein MreD